MEAPNATLRLRVVPGAAHPGVVGRHGDGWFSFTGVRAARATERLAQAARA